MWSFVRWQWNTNKNESLMCSTDMNNITVLALMSQNSCQTNDSQEALKATDMGKTEDKGTRGGLNLQRPLVLSCLPRKIPHLEDS